MFTKKDLNPISNDLFMLFVYLNSRIINHNIMLKGLPIPPSHMKVIFHLTMKGPCPVSRIANDLMISKPNMTPIIDNLIAEGYVHRYDDPNDRRIIIVELTEKSINLLSKKRDEMKILLTEKISALSEPDIEYLRSTLPVLTDIIKKID